MKRKSLRFMNLLLFLIIAFQCITPAFAASVPSPERAPRGEWKYEYDDPVYTYVSGWAGPDQNQQFHFPVGGYLIYSNSGGPSASFSINLGDPYGIISGSITLGSASDDGVSGTSYYVAPDNINTYNLWVTKKIEVTGYRSYFRLTSSDPWELYYSGAIHEVVGTSAQPKINGVWNE